MILRSLTYLGLVSLLVACNGDTYTNPNTEDTEDTDDGTEPDTTPDYYHQVECGSIAEVSLAPTGNGYEYELQVDVETSDCFVSGGFDSAYYYVAEAIQGAMVIQDQVVSEEIGEDGGTVDVVTGVSANATMPYAPAGTTMIMSIELSSPDYLVILDAEFTCLDQVSACEIHPL